MEIYRKRILCSVIASVLLVGCEFETDDSNSTTPTPNPTPQVDAISTDIVSGRVLSAAKDPVANTAITLTFQDKDGKTLTELSTQTDDKGFYRVDVPEIKADQHQANKLLVSFEKLGFTSNEKSLAISDSSTLVTLDAVLSPTVVKTVKRADLQQLVVSANGVPSLRFSLVSNSQGQQRILVGDAVAAADEDVQLTVDLPVTNIPEDVQAINSEVAYFDSSNQDDLQNFPGDFVGNGATDNQGQGVQFTRDDSSESYRLVSSTFSQIKLTNEDQDPLPLTGVSASNDSAPSIVMIVPKGSYPTIQRDFDTNEPNIQIPIYIYNRTRGWQYVGNGVLLSDANGTIATPADVNMNTTTGEIQLNGSEAIQLYVKVEITEANEWIQWINLDWPIKTGDNTDICFEGKVNYGDAEDFFGYVWFNLPDGGTDWVYAENGMYKYENSVFGDQATVLNPANWGISVINAKTGLRENIKVPDPLTLDPCNSTGTVTLINPYACTVKGHTFESDGQTGIANQNVALTTDRGRDFASTNTTGAYEQKVLCDVPIEVAALGQTQSVQVSQATSPQTVDFVKANQPPVLAVLRRGLPEIKIDETVGLVWTVSDPDGDAVTVTVNCATPADCTVTTNNNQATVGFNSIGSKTITVSASDGQATTSRDFDIQVRDTDNIAPEIIGFNFANALYAKGEAIMVRQGDAVTVTGVVTDRNGDAITPTWTGCTANGLDCAVATQATGPSQLTLSIVDDHSNPLSDTGSLTVNVVADQAPVISLLSITPQSLGSDGTNNTDTATIFAEFSDDFTPQGELAHSWMLTNQAQQDVTGLLGANIGTVIDLGKGILAVGDYTLKLTVTDSATTPNSTSKSIDFSVVNNAAPVVNLVSDVSTGTVLDGQTFAQLITLTATITDDGNADALDVNWQLLKEGQAVAGALTVAADGRSATIAANTLGAGNYFVMVTAKDEADLTGESEVSITLTEDKKPVFSGLTASPKQQDADDNGVSTQAVVLEATASDDIDTNLTYQWQFSSGVTAQVDGARAEIAAGTLAIGEHTATVTVSDSQNQTSELSVSFSVVEFEGNVGIIIE